MEFAERVGLALKRAGSAYEIKKMMGGLCLMVDDKMCLGIESNHLMVRVGPEAYESALKRSGCLPMDITGRPLKGFVHVDHKALKTEKQLDVWVKMALDYNPHAKRSKKKEKKPRK